MNSLSKKRKTTQNDLRLLMLEKKRKLTENKKKIDSPLAKYSDDGTLSCIICDAIIRTEAIWNIHINSKQHRENVILKKQSKEKSSSLSVPRTISIKRENDESKSEPVKLRGILKNKTEELPSQFNHNNAFESNLQTNSIPDTSSQMDVDMEPLSSKAIDSNELPEGFFDDPIMDAKARNVEYRDPVEEEWERFQKEIQEENVVSEQIVDEDQEVSAVDKEIDLIDEHMHLWSRLQVLEEELEKVQKKTSERKEMGNLSMEEKKFDDADSSYGSDEEFDEYIDWRSKKAFK